MVLCSHSFKFAFIKYDLQRFILCSILCYFVSYLSCLNFGKILLMIIIEFISNSISDYRFFSLPEISSRITFYYLICCSLSVTGCNSNFTLLNQPNTFHFFLLQTINIKNKLFILHLAYQGIITDLLSLYSLSTFFLL